MMQVYQESDIFLIVMIIHKLILIFGCYSLSSHFSNLLPKIFAKLKLNSATVSNFCNNSMLKN